MSGHAGTAAPAGAAALANAGADTGAFANVEANAVASAEVRAVADTVAGLLREIEGVGREPVSGGYARPVFGVPELELREWFTAHATARGLDVETDHNGTIWACWHGTDPGARAIATGSHLDSVPGGGQFDGPLGVATSLVAVDLLRARGFAPRKPIVIGVFPEEEGSRFGVACLGSRLLAGAIDPQRALGLKDPDGDTFADVAAAAGFDPARMGPDLERLARIEAFVELHVEQGRGLIDLDRAIAIGASILGHGRWRFHVSGQGNHAGTTLMEDRRDPMVAAAGVIAAAKRVARAHDGARATVGRLVPVPGGTNVIASSVDLWLDVRHPDDAVTAAVVERISRDARLAAAEEGCELLVTEESFSATTTFDAGLRDELTRLLPGAPVLDTGAGHDAGILAARIPTAMLFVRNPTGISHSPEEHVEDPDAEAGAAALADALQGLAG